VKGFSSECTALKADVLQGQKIYCLQAHQRIFLFIFQPGNFTGRDSEGVKLNFVVANESKQSYPQSPFYTKHDTREAHCAIRVSPLPINYIILKQTYT